jgi:hypothetical protein
MPTMNNYLNFLYVNLGFAAQIIVMMYFKSALEIKENWPLYRCNPPYWIFSENISEDFNYCVQNTQVNLMGYLLQPMNYMISSLSSMSSNFNESINQIRFLFSGTRDFVTNIVQSIFGVFLNMIIEFQKMIISIKDMVGKMIGIVVTIMYVLDGSIKTMNSAWAGPPGQLVKAIGSCFHPDTLVQLNDGTIYKMQDLPLGSELKDGGKIFSVMKIANLKNEYLYKIKGGVNNDTIYVTGEHFILDTKTEKWVMVKDHSDSILQKQVQCDWFSCIITTTRRIPIGSNTFWDWEDDELTKNYNNNHL